MVPHMLKCNSCYQPRRIAFSEKYTPFSPYDSVRGLITESCRYQLHVVSSKVMHTGILIQVP